MELFKTPTPQPGPGVSRGSYGGTMNWHERVSN